MSLILRDKKDQRNASTGWIWLIMLGVGLIGLSLGGIPLCQRLFLTFMGTNPSPVDASFAKIAAEVAWFVFFGPITVLGIAVFWSVARKVGALRYFGYRPHLGWI